MGVLSLMGIPIRLLKQTWANLLPSNDSRTVLALPVAGLDEAQAHQILSTLRAAATSSDDSEVAKLWLLALEMTQIASNRLVSELSLVERNLEYWVERLRQGKHLRTMLFGQGPLSFAKDVKQIVTKQERRDTASDRIERRVIVLRALQSKLAEALAQVHAAASLLHLRAAKSSAEEGGLQPALLLDVARNNIHECAAATAKAYGEVGEHAKKEFRGLLDMKTDLRQTALAQLLRLNTKKMFKMGSIHSLTQATSTAVDQEDGSTRGEGEALNGEEDEDDSAAAVLRRLQRTLDVEVEVDSGTSAHAAILQASSLSSEQSIIELPRWLTCPSKYSQNWIVYSLLSLGVGYGAIYLARHSRLCGSRDLERWTSKAVTAVTDAYQQHVVGPLLTVKNELFQTFRQRRSIVSAEDFEADKESLVRMLEDFRKDNASSKVARTRSMLSSDTPLPTNLSAEDLDKLRVDLDFMMAHYEGELKKPIRNLVSGRLPRTLLIQVQKLKLDTEAAMLQLDQILRANELSIALVAAIPAFMVAGFVSWRVWVWIMPSPPDARVEGQPCRMAMVEVERAVQALTDSETAEEQGLLMYRLALVYEEAIKLYRRHRSEASSEWRNLRADLVQLASPMPVKSKARVVKRMCRVYNIFRV